MNILEIINGVLFLLFGVLMTIAYHNGETDAMIFNGFVMLLWQNNLLALKDGDD